MPSPGAPAPSVPPPLAQPQAAAAGAVNPESLLQEVTVAAPEPRYVAPTRRDRIGRIWAPVYLNGLGPFRLVLDTGANRSAVIPSVAAALGPAAHTDKTVRLRGVTGTAMVPIIRVDRMEIGDMLLQPATLPVVPDVFGGADGVLGNEGLGDKRITIDFRHDSITVKRSRRQGAPPGFITVPVTMMRDKLLAIDVRVGGIPAQAIIDSGAPDSIGNLALLQALRRRPQPDPTTDIVGVTLDVEKGSYRQLPTITMKSVQIRGAEMTFSDVYILQHWHLTERPAVLLGMDVLGVLSQIIIDYRAREIYLEPAS